MFRAYNLNPCKIKIKNLKWAFCPPAIFLKDANGYYGREEMNIMYSNDVFWMTMNAESAPQG